MAKKKKKDKKTSFLVRGTVDYPMLVITLVLLAIGIIALSSASSPVSYKEKETTYYYLFRQSALAVVGLIGMYGCSRINWKIANKLPKIFMIVAYIAAIIIMALVGLKGNAEGGATRWISFAGISLQPSEFAKLVYIFVFAYYLSYVKERINIKDAAYGFFVPIALAGIAVVPILILQNHMSTSIIILVIAAVQMYVIGSYLISNKSFILGALALVAISLSMLFTYNAAGNIDWENAPKVFRITRIRNWLNPDYDPSDTGYQLNQSLYAIGSGGVVGVGLGNSKQKYLYIPEPQNDFIFSVFAEETGFVGSMVVIILFGAFIWRGITIAFNTKDIFLKLLVVGCVTMIGFAAIFNLAMVTNTIPITGVPLPFFSYGGSAIIANLVAVGVILAISRINNNEKEQELRIKNGKRM